MHEVSLAMALLELVREQAAAAQANRVTRLVLEIGVLSCVDPHALRFAVEVAAQGGLAEGAELEILQPQGRAYCLDCETSVTLLAHGRPCPRCGGVKLLAQGGDEMRLKEMEVT
jgi:hydrogenase nickel incorporation protein HypA/HybF